MGIAGGGADPTGDHGVGAFRILRQQAVGHVQHVRQQAGVTAEIGDAVADVAGLPGAEQFARAAQRQVLFGDQEAVVGLSHHLDAFARHG